MHSVCYDHLIWKILESALKKHYFITWELTIPGF